MKKAPLMIALVIAVKRARERCPSPALAAVAGPSLPARPSGGSPRTPVANAPTDAGEACQS